jgi:hypothetical protein
MPPNLGYVHPERESGFGAHIWAQDNNLTRMAAQRGQENSYGAMAQTRDEAALQALEDGDEDLALRLEAEADALRTAGREIASYFNQHPDDWSVTIFVDPTDIDIFSAVGQEKVEDPDRFDGWSFRGTAGELFTF